MSLFLCMDKENVVRFFCCNPTRPGASLRSLFVMGGTIAQLPVDLVSLSSHHAQPRTSQTTPRSR
jgi:hypothetical protein